MAANSKPNYPPDPTRLVAFEDKVGARLPSDYRQFLLASNGGDLTPEEIIFPGQTEPFTVLRSPTFGLHDGDSSLDKVYDNCEDAIPAEVFAFAEDYGGNLLCLGIHGEHIGHVFFWDHERSRPGDEVPGFAGMTLLAGSFTEFVAHLGKPQPGV